METPTGLDTPLGQMLVRMSPENLKDQIFKAQFNLDKLKALPQLILEANYGKRIAKKIMEIENSLEWPRQWTRRCLIEGVTDQNNENTIQQTERALADWKDPKKYKKK